MARFGRFAWLFTIAALSLAVTSCDQKKSDIAAASATRAPQTATPAALDPNRHPTNDEIFAAFMQAWRQYAASSGPLYQNVVPISVGQAPDGITQTVYGVKEYSVAIRFMFRVGQPVLYSCTPDSLLAIELHYPNAFALPGTPAAGTQAKAGDVVYCDITRSFTKIDEGWLFHANGVVSYAIRR